MMRPIRLAAPSLLLLAAGAPAFAACRGESLYSCQIGGKKLEICQSDAAVTYRFGPAGKPELQITTPVADLDYRPWPGMGRAISEAVTFENDGTRYEVWSSFDRLDEDALPEGGVNVISGGKTLASLRCKRGSVEAGLDLLYGAKEGLGQCWSIEQQGWRIAPCP